MLRPPPSPRRATFDHYAFHWGGRSELQFNIGFEGPDRLRWGLGFSLQRSRSLPDVEIIFPKIAKFNEFMILHGEKYQHLRMWHFDDGGRSDNRYPGPIEPDLLKEGVFIFLGKADAPEAFDPDLVLRDFDRLLPLYEYVEGDRRKFPHLTRNKTFSFTPGHTPKREKTTAVTPHQLLDVDLRHNMLQDRLVSYLGAEDRGGEIASEHPTGNGGLADVLERVDDEYRLYEIKLGASARSCIRQAIGQLLDYSLWPHGLGASRLVVVGEPALDEEASAFLKDLQQRGLPVSYLQVTLDN